MRHPSKILIYLSVVIALLSIIASLLGIFNPLTYSRETVEWARQGVGQDIGNLIAVTVFVICLYILYRKKSIAAYVMWIGTLLYFIYAYVIYAFFIHFNYLFLVYVAVLGLSFYTLIGGILTQDLSRLIAPISGKSMKTASSLLVAIGVLFALLWLSEIIPALLSGQVPTSITDAGMWVNPVHVIDLSIVLPGMILTGLLLRKKQLYGYVFAGPWLMFSVLMGSSIIVTLLIELAIGNAAATVPLLIVSIIVLLSAIVLYTFLSKSNRQR